MPQLKIMVQVDEVKLVQNDGKWFRELHVGRVCIMMIISTVSPAHQRHMDVSQMKVPIFEELLISIRDSTTALALLIGTLHKTVGSYLFSNSKFRVFQRLKL